MAILPSPKTKQNFTDRASCSIGKINCNSAGFTGNVGISFMSGVRQIQSSNQEYEVFTLGKELLSTSFIKSTTVGEDIKRWPCVPACKPPKSHIYVIKCILSNERSVTPRSSDGEGGEGTVQGNPDLEQAGHVDVAQQQFFRYNLDHSMSECNVVMSVIATGPVSRM